MPWTADDAQGHTSHADTDKKRRQWAAVANSALNAGHSEGSAIRQANAAVHKMDEGAKSFLEQISEHQKAVDDAAQKVYAYLQKRDPELLETLRKNTAESSVEMTLPLLIRLLEYAKEDAGADIDPHQIAERASQMSGVLDTDAYSELVPQDKKNKVAKDMTAGDVHVTTALGNQGGSKKISVSFLQALGDRKPKKVEDAAPAKTVMEKAMMLRVTKLDAEQQKVFGWAYISKRGGHLIVDKQNDAILPEDLETAAHDYALHWRSQGDMHEQGRDGVAIQRGRLIESMVFTPEKYEKAGLIAFDPDTQEQLYGWFVGFKVDDPRLWDAHKRGERPEFSIGGRGRRVEFETVGKATVQRNVMVVRHGATKLNNDDVSVDRIRGWSDIPLSPDGKDEAVRLAKVVMQDPPDVIVSSDLKRAAETAKIISAYTDIPVSEYSQGFRPWNVGIYAGQVSKFAVPELANYVRNSPAEPVPEGESFNDFRRRFFGALQDTLDKYEGRVAIVTHHRGERLMAAWAKSGYPADGDINYDTFCQRGEPTGTIMDLVVGLPPYQMAAE